MAATEKEQKKASRSEEKRGCLMVGKNPTWWSLGDGGGLGVSEVGAGGGERRVVFVSLECWFGP